MCNREISSRRIDRFFRETLRQSGADRQRRCRANPLHWRRWQNTEHGRGLTRTCININITAQIYCCGSELVNSRKCNLLEITWPHVLANSKRLGFVRGPSESPTLARLPDIVGKKEKVFDSSSKVLQNYLSHVFPRSKLRSPEITEGQIFQKLA